MEGSCSPIFGEQVRALESGQDCQDIVIGKANATKLTVVNHTSAQASQLESFDSQLNLSGFI